MRTLNWNRIYDTVVKIAWALLFVCLPVTSFPYFPGGPGGKTLVRPLSIYPLLLLLILIIIPRLFTQPVPRTFLPLLAFIVVALISSTLAFTSEKETLHGVSMWSRFVRNIVTLGIGGAFYITCALLPRKWEDLRFSLRWLYAGFGVALLWGALQIVYVIHYSPTYFELISQIQSFFSTRKLFTSRISGLTYEPKWFAEQICILLLPWLLGSVLSSRTIFKWRFKWITIEWILLVWAAAVIFFTFSRTGVAILAIIVLISFILYRFHLSGQSKVGQSGIGQSSIDSTSKQAAQKRKSRRLLEVVLLIVGMLTVVIVVGSQNPYFSRFWSYWDKERKRTYLEFIAFQQRIVYFETALRIYDAYPVFGVGLGNYAFYFDEMLPNRDWHRQPEIVRQITPVDGRDRLITPKNLVARLLAETGLVGMVTFLAFIVAVLGCVLFLWFSPTPEQRYWGISGLLGMAVFALIVFSFDSFALPNMWVLFGLMTAAAHIADPVVLPSEASATG